MVRYKLGFVILPGEFMTNSDRELGEADKNEANAEAAEVLAGQVVEIGGEIVKGAEGEDDDDCVVEVDEAILRDLGPKQLKALELLLRGKRVKEITKKAR